MKGYQKPYQIHIEGLVQGIGFRPYIYRLATQCNLSGTVDNRRDGVWINLLCNEGQLRKFINLIPRQAPPATRITRITTLPGNGDLKTDRFSILPSKNDSGLVSGICPDIAICEDCLHELENPGYRHNYPFINCTNCGPRFSIINKMPYDRSSTSMADFQMCSQCSDEFSQVEDRRFHAQPIACWDCGPVYYSGSETENRSGWPELLSKFIDKLEHGFVCAVQGIGGYHLMCDASSRQTVELLRNRKMRDGKPFAVMFRNMDAINSHCKVSLAEAAELQSWRRPIVLLETRNELNAAINCGLSTLGVMLPYTPLHHLIFKHSVLDAILCTSANISEEPIVKEAVEAEKKLQGVADFFLHSNRSIINRCDDSVVRIIGNNPVLIRRSRGYVPHSISLMKDVTGILAIGGELKNTFCMGIGNEAIISQHIGDLKNPETMVFFEETIDQYCKLFHFKPEQIICDLHPDYLSSQYAQSRKLPVSEVQHHHAHILSAMAEHHLSCPVIGVAFDGAGLGPDGLIWGGEFFISEPTKFVRIDHFPNVYLAGGDLAAREPWRMAASWLYHYYGADFEDHLEYLSHLPIDKVKQQVAFIDSGIPLVKTSSVGRLFDAVASLTGVCQENTFEAEAAMRLESIASKGNSVEAYPINMDQPTDLKPLFDGLLIDIKEKRSLPLVAARFHLTISEIILAICCTIGDNYAIKQVVLSGGSFQNRVMTERACALLEAKGFEVFTNRQVPPNDGGISLGQLFYAANLK